MGTTMATDTGEVLEAVTAAREAWDECQERVHDLKAAMRRCPSNAIQWELQPVEAYDALVGRDEGMGMSMSSWLDEIERAEEGGEDDAG